MTEPTEDLDPAQEKALRLEFRRRFGFYLISSICVTLLAVGLVDLLMNDKRLFNEQPAIYVTVPFAVLLLSLWRSKQYYQAFRKKYLQDMRERK